MKKTKNKNGLCKSNVKLSSRTGMYVAPISCKDRERERKKEKNYQKHETDARIPARGFSPTVNYDEKYGLFCSHARVLNPFTPIVSYGDI